MSKENNLSQEQLDFIASSLKMASKGKMDIPKDIKNNSDLEDFVMERLNSKQTDVLKNLLQNKNALEELLSTPQAKHLLTNLVKGNENG